MATIGSGVVGTDELHYEYDGLGRVTRSQDSTDGTLDNGDDWVVEYTWDALNRAKTEKQNNRTTTSSWREEAKRTSMGYSSGVTVQYAYDALERATSITKGTSLATYSYAGRDRLFERNDGGGVVQRYHSDSGDDAAYYDGAKRPTRVEFKLGTTLLTGIVPVHGPSGMIAGVGCPRSVAKETCSR